MKIQAQRQKRIPQMYKTNTYSARRVLDFDSVASDDCVLVIEKRKSDVKKMSQVLTPLYSLFIHNGSLKATVHFPVQ
jgi:hypothetical protein